MRVGGQALAAHLLTVVVQLLLAEAPFQEGAGVHARGAVALEEDQVAALFTVLAVPEVVLADLIENGGAGIAGNVAADVGVLAGANHHGQGVPTHIGFDFALQVKIARVGGLLLHGNGIDIVGGETGLEIQTLFRRLGNQGFKNIAGAFLTLHTQKTGQRGQPFLGFLGVDVFNAHISSK